MCVNDIFGYKVTNSALFKEINALLDSYSYNDVFGYLSENFDYISQCLEKNFSSEYARIRYFAAIVKNNIKDYVDNKPTGVIEKTVKIDVDDTHSHYSRKKKRRGLSEIEDGGDWS